MPARSATPIDVESDEAKAEYWWRRCQEAFAAAAAARAKADELTVKRLAREEAERAEEEQRQKEAARIAAVKEAQRVAARVAQKPPSGELMWGRAVWPLWACLL